MHKCFCLTPGRDAPSLFGPCWSWLNIENQSPAKRRSKARGEQLELLLEPQPVESTLVWSSVRRNGHQRPPLTLRPPEIQVQGPEKNAVFFLRRRRREELKLSICLQSSPWLHTDTDLGVAEISARAGDDADDGPELDRSAPSLMGSLKARGAADVNGFFW